MSTTTQTLSFLQRRLKAIQSDIDDVTVMYLQAVSTKNIQLAEQCELSLHLAHTDFYTISQSLKEFQQPSNYPSVV